MGRDVEFLGSLNETFYVFHGFVDAFANSSENVYSSERHYRLRLMGLDKMSHLTRGALLDSLVR